MNEYFSPDAVEVENGIAKLPDLPSQVFYYVRDPELIIFESETQTAGPGGVALMTRMLDFAQQLKVGTIFTGAAFERTRRAVCKTSPYVIGLGPTGRAPIFWARLRLRPQTRRRRRRPPVSVFRRPPAVVRLRRRAGRRPAGKVRWPPGARPG